MIFFLVLATGFPTVESDSIQGLFLYVGMGFLAKASQCDRPLEHKL